MIDPEDCYESRHEAELDALADAALELQIAEHMDREHARRHGRPVEPPPVTIEVEVPS